MYLKLLFCILLLFIFNQAAKCESILTEEELKWIREHKDSIRFAPNPSWPPADFIDDQGMHQGIVADYIKIFEEKLGISFINTHFHSWSHLLEGVQNSETDFVGSIHKTTDRTRYLNFTDPFLEIPVVILVRNDYSNIITPNHINQMRLAGVAGYTTIDHIKSAYPESEVVEFQDDLTALMQTSLGHTDGAIVDIMTASFLVEKFGITNLALGITLKYKWEIRFATRKQLPELQAILNKLLESVDENQKQAIYHKWVNLDNIKPEGFFERNKKRIAILSLCILAILLASASYNFILKKQVRHKTRDLQIEMDEKNKALQKVKESEENYRFLFEHEALPKWIYDLETLKIIEVNKKAVSHYGYSKDEFLTMKIVELLSPEAIPRQLNINPQGQTKGATIFYGIGRHKKKNGDLIYVEVYSSAVDYNGRLCKMIVVNDVTDKIKTYEALQESYERYDYVTKASNEAIWDWDIRSNELFWGEGVYTLFGHEAPLPAKGFHVWEKNIHPENKKYILKSIRQALGSSAKRWIETYRFMKANSQYAYVQNQAIIVRNTEGVAVRMVGAIRDITERMNYVNAIEEQNAQLKEIAWIQSHVVRAPMSRMMSLINLINQGENLQLDRTQLLSHVITSAHELDGIIKDIVEKSQSIKDYEIKSTDS